MKFKGPKHYLDIIEASVKTNTPLLLIGETGTGKTTTVKEVATKHGKELIRINLTGETRREDLVGKYVLISGETVRQDGPLVNGLKNGKRILFDEMNAALPDVLLTIQALCETKDSVLGNILLSEKDGETIVPHNECRLFATANPADKYVGTKDFNPATLDRFNVLNVECLSQVDEQALLEELYPNFKDEIFRLVAISYELRTLYRGPKNDGDGDITFFCSTRMLVYILELLKGGLDLTNAISAGLLNKCMNSFDKPTVLEVINKHMTVKVTDIKKTREMMEELRDSKVTKAEYDAISNEIKEIKELNLKLSQGIIDANHTNQVTLNENKRLKEELEKEQSSVRLLPSRKK